MRGGQKLSKLRKFLTSNTETFEFMGKFWYNRLKNAGGA